MAFKPISRFDVQVVWSGGGYTRWESRRDVPHTPESIANALERYVAQIREGIKREADAQALRRAEADRQEGEKS